MAHNLHDANGDIARLVLLGEIIAFVASLPSSGAHVLVGSRSAWNEMHDAIVQYRGRAMREGTKLFICLTEDEERRITAGRDARLVYAAPGFTPKWAICLGGKLAPAKPADDPLAAIRPTGLGHLAGIKDAVPGALQYAWPKAQPTHPAAQTGGAPAWTESLPTSDAAPPARGPWHQPKAEEIRHVEVVVKSFFVTGSDFLPYRLRADLPCGEGYVEAFTTQTQADAALPDFVKKVRAQIEAHLMRDRTVTVKFAA